MIQKMRLKPTIKNDNENLIIESIVIIAKQIAQSNENLAKYTIDMSISAIYNDANLQTFAKH